MARVLIVDDDPQVLGLLSTALAARGHAVLEAVDGAAGLALGVGAHPDAAVLDIQLPDFTGDVLLDRLRAGGAAMPAIAITGYGSDAGAAACLARGFQDYVDKPFRPLVLVSKVERLVGAERPADVTPAKPARREVSPAPAPQPATMMGRSPAMRAVYAEIARAAATDYPVLITGETGTGKDLAARAVHDASARKKGPFVAVNCATGSTLFESQCFGHERGAFTDARERHAGWFEQAHGGTLFLDEIGETPLDAQAKLLRAIESRQIIRLGGTQTIPVDVRLIFATNSSLQSKIAAGAFREDLYYRVDGMRLALPALRERKQDLAEVSRFLLDVAEGRDAMMALTSEAVEALGRYDWPGNVRELRQVLLRAYLRAENGRIESSDVDESLRSVPSKGTVTSSSTMTLVEAISTETRRIEREMIGSALARTERLVDAAKLLGIDRRTLYSKIEDT